MEENELQKPKDNRKPRSAVFISGALLSIGMASLVLSILYTFVILAFIGLGLIFWGALLLYVKPEEYTSKVVLDAALLPLSETLNQILSELGYKGKEVYLPPEYMADPDESRVYVPRNENGEIPPPQLVLKHGDIFFLDNQEGILMTPAGAELTKLFERRLGTSFTKKNLEYVTEKLPRLLIENLQIVEDIQLSEDSTSNMSGETTREKNGSSFSSLGKNKTIKVRITNSIFKDLYERINCPICSAIACTLTKVTGKPIIIEEISSSDNGETIQATYQVQQFKESQKTQKGKISEALALRFSRFSRIVASFAIILGITLIALVGWVTWYDVTVWEKHLYDILLGSRTNQLIGLGINIKLMYYLLIGLVLLALGVIMYIQSKEKS